MLSALRIDNVSWRESEERETDVNNVKSLEIPESSLFRVSEKYQIP